MAGMWPDGAEVTETDRDGAQAPRALDGDELDHGFGRTTDEWLAEQEKERLKCATFEGWAHADHLCLAWRRHGD